MERKRRRKEGFGARKIWRAARFAPAAPERDEPSLELAGRQDGLGGRAATSKGFVDPFPEPEFGINAGPIGSVNGSILPTEMLPPDSHLENADQSLRKRTKMNKNVQLSSLATRGF